MQDAAIVRVRPFYGGEWHDADEEETLADKFTDRPTTSVALCSQTQVREAIGHVVQAQARHRLVLHERHSILANASRLLDARREEMIATLVADSGFTISDSTREVDRSVQTLLVSAEEAKRLVGEVVPMDAAPGQRDRLGYTTFHPRGVVCAITPFNSPLNTVLHKVAPALAAGNGVVLKPAFQTPRCADALVHLFLDAGLPADLLSVVYGDGKTVGQWLLDDLRPDFYAFTGSTAVGEHIHRTIGLRPSQLEMGSLSSTIICADTDLPSCVDLVINAGFRKAGQVCTSVQRLYVQRAVLDEVTELLRAGLAAKEAGDPSLAQTFVGPLISPGEAHRVQSWVEHAVSGGATLVSGGSRSGSVIEPTVLAQVTASMEVMSREVFGPVVVLRPFGDIEGAIAEINDTPYGLAAGIFTCDIRLALIAADRLRMGAVHINETSSSRVDLMPYSGVKASGHGTEGPRYAMREMSEQRLVTMARPQSSDLGATQRPPGGDHPPVQL